MATERQIEANRRNAQKSTGPRSAPGKNLSSKNSYKHGSSTQTSINAVDVETLAGQIAGPAKGHKVLELARAIAEADIRLKEIGQLKIVIIESAKKVGIDRAARGRSEGPRNQKTHSDGPSGCLYLTPVELCRRRFCRYRPS